MFGSTAETLGGITDAESATAALPQLEEAKSSLDGLGSMLSGADDTVKSAAGGVIGKGTETLSPMIEKLQGNEGAWSVIEPVVGPMMETLKGLGG